MVDFPVCVFLVVTIILGCSHHSNGQKLNRQKRTLRWVTKESALQYLTEEMSDMDYFKTQILKPICKERVSGTKANEEVQEFIKSKLKSFGWDVEEDRFEDNTPYGKKNFNNIIATYDPAKPRKIVIACHFDSKYYAEGGFIGATDSAVPCAIMLETVRQLDCLLAKGPKEKSSVKDVTLQLLFLDGEEAFKTWSASDSIYGARHLADKWADEFASDGSGNDKLSTIREFILLDLIGTNDTMIHNEFPAATSKVYLHLNKAEKHLKEKGYLTRKNSPIIFSADRGFGRIEDDHIPFMQRDVPIVHLISYPFPHVWHKMSDTWENLDFDLINDFSRIFRVFVSNLMHLQPEYIGCRKKAHQEL